MERRERKKMGVGWKGEGEREERLKGEGGMEGIWTELSELHSRKHRMDSSRAG